MYRIDASLYLRSVPRSLEELVQVRCEWYIERCIDQNSDHPMATTPAEIMVIP